MIKFNHIYTELYIFTFILAVTFALFSNVRTNSLISVIIIFLFGIGIYLYLDQISSKKDASLQYNQNLLDNDIQERGEANEKIFYIDKFPKKAKYLKESNELMNIVRNLRFTIKFNKTRYTDIILNMNKLMKIYIYILSDRYDATHFIPIFTDIRDNIIEIMYSLFMVIPPKLKHVYGVDPYQEMYRSIYDFMDHSKNMLHILEKYAIIYKDVAYIPDNSCKPYNSITSSFP